jgi:multiple sugar transport system substrate-binding protein
MKQTPRTKGPFAGAAAAVLALSACATGTGGTETETDADFGPETEVVGELSVMGFSASDDVAETRLEATKEAMPAG